MADSSTSDIRLSHLVNADGCLRPGVNPFPLQHVLKGQGVDYRSQHSGIVRSYAVDTVGLSLTTTPYVTPADDDSYLHPHFHYALDLFGYLGKGGDIDAELIFPGKGLTAELEKYSLVLGLSHPPRPLRLTQIWRSGLP